MSNNNICPICKKDTVEKYRPFCSIRCANIDLGKWLNESYIIETDDQISEEESDI